MRPAERRRRAVSNPTPPVNTAAMRRLNQRRIGSREFPVVSRHVTFQPPISAIRIVGKRLVRYPISQNSGRPITRRSMTTGLGSTSAAMTDGWLLAGWAGFGIFSLVVLACTPALAQQGGA